MDPYQALGITPGFEGDLRQLRNRLAKRYFEAGDAPDEERMKAINLAYELLSDPVRRRAASVSVPFSIATGALPTARVGEPYRAPLTLLGGVAPYTWEAALPDGLKLDATGTIGGRAEQVGSVPFTLTVTDRYGRTAKRVLVLHVAPAPAPVRARAGDATEWTPARLADEQHAQAVAAHEAGVDVAATRARIAQLQARLARRALDRSAIAAAILAAAAVAVLLSMLIGLLAIALAGAALLYGIGPALLAPARRAELERLRSLLGCGRVDCARCRTR